MNGKRKVKNFYTTNEVGEICGVFPSTVANWIKAGKLKCGVTPGGHRRIKRDALLAFMRQHDFSVPGEFASTLKRLYVIDDDPSVLKMFQRLFRDYQQKFEVKYFSSGIDALVEIGEHVPDLVVVDMVMPTVDGPSMIASLQANLATKNVKIVAITGKLLSAKKKSLLKKNADAYFEKPLDVEKIRSSVTNLLSD